MTKYIFFILLTSNTICSMEYVTPETLFQASPPTEKKLSKRKLTEAIEELMGITWKNLHDHPIDVKQEPETACYLLHCLSCGEKRSLYKSKLEHDETCSLWGKKYGWTIVEKPTTQYEVEAICPYTTGKCKIFSSHYLLWQVARLPENMKSHIKTQHSDQKLTKKELRQRIQYRQSITPGEVKEIKRQKARSKNELDTQLTNIATESPLYK